MDVRNDTPLRDNYISKEPVQSFFGVSEEFVIYRDGYLLFIVTNGELEMTGYNTLLFVVARCVACELKNLCGEVFKNSGEIDCKRKLERD